MYAHKVIEDLIDGQKKIDLSHPASGAYRKIGNELINSIPRTHQFYLGKAFNLAKVMGIQHRSLDLQKYYSENIKHFKLPYHPLYLEWETINPRFKTESNNCSKTVVLLKEYNDRPNEIYLVGAGYWSAYNRFFPLPQIAIFNFLEHSVKLGGVDRDIANHRMMAEICILTIASMLVLNCKNIKYKKKHPDKKLNKKRMSKKHIPLFVYHTLEFEPLEVIIYKADKKIDNTKVDRRVHLCKGHFKTYTKDNPLFGKYIGLYWWQPHVRGNIKKGVVVKDYKLREREIA
jgi:hypothetical protein